MAEQWKVEMFRTRKWNIGCTCRALIPGVMSERRDPSCPVHGWEGDEEAEEGRSIVENDAIRAEHEA